MQKRVRQISLMTWALSCLLFSCSTTVPTQTSSTRSSGNARSSVDVQPEPMPLEHWALIHGEAARDLGVWIHTQRKAARRLFEWDGKHPEESHELVTWLLANPNVDLDVFTNHHREWRLLVDLVTNHRVAMDAFMTWCRRNRPAVEALMIHPRALEWVGHHLYEM
jgi:hypothetical protein